MSREADAEVAALIELYYMCETFHALPGAGGILDQDSYLMYGLLLVASAVQEKTAKEHPNMS
jgi:uncharacterized membrane protein